MILNLYAGWIGLLAGVLAGIVSGLFFHNESWLGGYASWRRRLVRLAHISFFGLGLINIAFYVSLRALGIETGLALPSVLLVVGAISMPAVCYLSAYRLPLRNFFFVPVLSVTAAITLFLWKVLFV